MRDFLLILHFIGLAMGLGTSFAHMFLGIASSKMPKEEGRSFLVKCLAIDKMGMIGLGLLIISGLGLMMPYVPTMGKMPLFHAKLTLVVILTLLIMKLMSLSKKARSGQVEETLPKMEKLGKMTLPIALAIVVLAVLTFH